MTVNLPCMGGCGRLILSRRGNRPRRCHECWKVKWRQQDATKKARQVPDDLPANEIEARYQAALRVIKAQRWPLDLSPRSAAQLVVEAA